MGCIWSCESGDDNSRYSSPRASTHNTRRNTKNDRYGFGNFVCPCCQHTWDSRKAWKEEKQGCSKCNIYCYKHKIEKCSQCWTYPYSWRPLTAEDCNNPDAGHKEDLCDMCKKLGYYCGDKHKRNKQVKKSSRPRNPIRKNTKMPSRPPSYNAAMRSKLTTKRFAKY